MHTEKVVWESFPRTDNPLSLLSLQERINPEHHESAKPVQSHECTLVSRAHCSGLCLPQLTPKQEKGIYSICVVSLQQMIRLNQHYSFFFFFFLIIEHEDIIFFSVAAILLSC